MGLDISESLCEANMVAILEQAAALHGFVRLDMESSEYAQRTLDFFRGRLFDRFGAHCGVVIQSMLRRSEQDIEDLIAMKARVRLCKGAYLEPPALAFPEKADVDKNYVRLMERLLLAGNYPGLATHDEAIIAHARSFVRRHGIGTERFEFQMLYGVRRDLQENLRKAGYRLRVYIPFGTQWYSYHAAAGGATRQHRLPSWQHRAGVGTGTVSELTLGGYMAKHERAAAFGGSDGQAYSVAIYVDEEPDVRDSTERRCCSCAGPPPATGRSGTWRARRWSGPAPRPRPPSGSSRGPSMT